LCPDSDSRSTGTCDRSIGSLPTACTASVCSATPLDLTMRAISAMGKITPVSLLAHITLTMAVSGVIAAASSSDQRPLAVHAELRQAEALLLQMVTHATDAGCSTRVVMMWRLWPASASTAPRIAQLSLSEPPLVNTISAGDAPIRAATCARARSTSCPRCRRSCACWTDCRSPAPVGGHRLHHLGRTHRGGVVVEIDHPRHHDSSTTTRSSATNSRSLACTTSRRVKEATGIARSCRASTRAPCCRPRRSARCRRVLAQRGPHLALDGLGDQLDLLDVVSFFRGFSLTGSSVGGDR